MAGIIQVVPVGGVARARVKELAEPLHDLFGVEVVHGAALSEPKYAFNQSRSQYHSSAILRRLAAAKAKDQLGILGVTELDLFVPDSPFVIGEADRECHAAVVSLWRLRPEAGGGPQDSDLLRSRGRTEVIHGVGHLVGLARCDDARCVMFLSSSAGETDRKGCSPCNECRAELARLTKGR